LLDFENLTGFNHLEVMPATVALDTAMPCLRPTRAANFSSNCLTNGPSEDIYPDSIHSGRYFFSCRQAMVR
jgi:hypothetical protein